MSSALLQLVDQWLNFTSSRTNAFRYGRQSKNHARQESNSLLLDFRTTINSINTINSTGLVGDTDTVQVTYLTTRDLDYDEGVHNIIFRVGVITTTMMCLVILPNAGTFTNGAGIFYIFFKPKCFPILVTVTDFVP